MNELVTLDDNNTPVTDSLKVADYFDKEHKHVMRDIRKLIDRGVSSFGPSSYINDQNKEQPMFTMDRQAWMLLVFGFNGDKAFEVKQQFVDAFDKMEATINDQAQEIERLTAVCERLEAAVLRLEEKPKDTPASEAEPELRFPCSFQKALSPRGIKPRVIYDLLIELGHLKPMHGKYGYEILKFESERYIMDGRHPRLLRAGFEAIMAMLDNCEIPPKYLK